MADARTTTATRFKQRVGYFLEEARSGPVLIERHGRPTAVLLSADEYEALGPATGRFLDTLRADFDALVDRLQRPAAHKALASTFDAPVAELGAAHRRRPKRRGR